VTILAATGLQREQRALAGAGVEVVVSGGDHQRLETTLDRLAAGKRGIISIGIAGALAPGLKIGDWLIASAVLDGPKALPTDPAWSDRLAARLPGATKALLLGSDAVVVQAVQKAVLHRTTGAFAVDMESHVVGRVAERHGLPFAAARVVSDAARHTLPPAALVGMRPDGRMDPGAVLASLLLRPWQLPALIRTGLDAERAFGVLLGGCRRLGPGLVGPDLGQPSLDVT
jgi:hopanoid-associated phosphorylase